MVPSRASVAFCRWCCNRVFLQCIWVQEASTLVVYPSTDEELLADRIGMLSVVSLGGGEEGVWRRGNLPPACLRSFFTDATGGYPGGVWYGSLCYVTARPTTKAPVTSLYLRGRRCTAAPNEVNHQPRMYRNLCCTWYDAYVPAWHLRIVMCRC